jgi:hypothetical protein
MACATPLANTTVVDSTRAGPTVRKSNGGGPCARYIEARVL